MKSLEEIMVIKGELEKDLIKQPGVTGIDVGYRVIDGKTTDVFSIRVYVSNKAEALKQLKLPTEIQDVPVDLIERTFVLH